MVSFCFCVGFVQYERFHKALPITALLIGGMVEVSIWKSDKHFHLSLFFAILDPIYSFVITIIIVQINVR